ncbi:carbonic anhydrase 15 [Diachasma alloeum]|uniref:carbonic anhydrase 15 n=1 Tax=Diachasma alloeum TaxID=454923 RepID=UPI000738518A|nr:carbonic anhydrase 15 [Diachasma alloeum]
MEVHLVFAAVLLSHASLAFANFAYDGLHGPQHWGEDYNGCVGKHQSPINIQEHIVRNVSFPELKFFGLESLRGCYIENNGHTVMLKMNKTERPSIFGGPLGSHEYVFEQLHFHWGENDHEGSEDLINNHSFAMELHAVFYKKIYGSFQQAIHHPDGLTVLAYFFEASEEDNPNYALIVESLPLIEAVDSSTNLNPMALESLLLPNPAVLQDYFTYNGSLTTPPCSEVVTWIDFKEALPLSHKQIAAFRNVRGPEGVKLTHNFRPIQPLEDRVVYRNIHVPEDNAHHHDFGGSGQSSLHVSLPIALGAMLLTAPPEIWTGVLDLFTTFR